MAPGTQLVFLYLYYLQTTDTVNLTQISRDLLLSKATCTRAIDDLTVSGLITYKTEGTNKWISPSFNKPEFLKKGYPRLKSPVERLIYVRTPSMIQHCPKAVSLLWRIFQWLGQTNRMVQLPSQKSRHTNPICRNYL